MSTALVALPCPLCECPQTTFFFQDSKNHQHRYQRCPACDVVFVPCTHWLKAEDEKARYDMHHNDYSEPYMRFLSRLATPMLAKLSQSSDGLDFGSGVSQAMAELFRQAGHSCVCYDIFYYPDTGLLAKQYDFVIASEVIEHLYHPKQVFKQWLDLLKPDGVLGIMTSIRPDDEAFANWGYKNDPTHVLLFSQATFAYLQAQYGLTLLFSDKGVFVFQLCNST